MPCMREHRKTTAASLPSDCTQVALDSFRLKSTEDQGEIELRNIEAGVLQVLFGMLHLMGEALLTEISRLQFCKKDKKNCTLHIKVVYLPTV